MASSEPEDHRISRLDLFQAFLGGDGSLVDTGGHPFTGLHGQWRVDGDAFGQRQRSVETFRRGYLADQAPPGRLSALIGSPVTSSCMPTLRGN